MTEGKDYNPPIAVALTLEDKGVLWTLIDELKRLNANLENRKE